MAQPIDTAYVELRARGTKEASRDIAQVLRQIERDVAAAADDIERQLEGAFDGVDDQLAELDAEAKKALNNVEDAAEDAARSLGTSMAAGAEAAKESIDDMADDAISDLERLDRQIAQTKLAILALGREFIRGNHDVSASLNDQRGLLSHLTRLRKEITSFGEAVPKAVEGANESFGVLTNTFKRMASSFTIQGVLMLGLIAALVPLVIPLVAALADLAGLLLALPAAVGVLAAVIAPLVIAFQGMGDAVSALASGDIDKINEALKGLAPSARAVAYEINNLRKPLEQLKKAVQESFFAPLRGTLTQLVNALGPTLTRGLSQVAGSLGRFLAQLGDLLSNNDIVEDIGDVFQATARIVDRVGPSILNLFGTLFGVMEHGLPFIERAADAFANLLDRFSGFLAKSMQTGDFDKFLEDAVATLKDLWHLAGAFWDLMVSIFGDADDEGRSLIETLTGIERKMAEFFESPKGKEFIQAIVDAAPLILGFISFLTGAFITIVGFLIDLGHWIEDAVESIKGFWNAITSGVTTALDALGNFFGAVGEFFTNLWHGITSGLTDAWNAVVDFVKNLPTMLLDALKAMVDGILFAIGASIGIIIFAFTTLPGLIVDALQALPGIIGNFFVDAWNWATTTTVNAVIAIGAWLATLVANVITFLSQLPTIIGNWFLNAWNAAVNFTLQGIASVISFVQSVPGRLLAFGSAFLNAGASLMQGFFNGLKSIGGFAGDLGSAVWRSIKGFLNSAISGINRGISAVDAVLPGSLPRIPMLAKGGMVGGFTLAALGEGGRREVVIPLEDPRALAAMRDAGIGGGTVTFESGAIQIMFQGVVPTEQEALSVASTIGAGIASTLQQRNVRTSVRTI